MERNTPEFVLFLDAPYTGHKAYMQNKEDPAMQGIALHLLYSNALHPLTVHLYNPFVREEDVLSFLLRYCVDVREGVKLKDKHGFWNGKRRYNVRSK